MTVDRRAATGLAHCVCELQRTLRAVVSAPARIAGLGVAHEGVLHLVGDSGGSRAGDIAARLGVGPSALSRRLADLEGFGLLLRRLDPADGGAQLLSLSAKGGECLADAGRRRADGLQRLPAGWSGDRTASSTECIENLPAALRRAKAPRRDAPHHEPSTSRAMAAGPINEHALPAGAE